MAPALRLVVVALAALILLPRPLAALDGARQLLSQCETIDRGAAGSGREVEIPATREALLCWGYLEAFQDLAALSDPSGNRLLGACPPEDGTLLDLVRAFVTYGRARGSELPENSAVAVIRALQQAYPCPASKQPPKR